jgi:capsular exopolysaccharide synthesis family protein
MDKETRFFGQGKSTKEIEKNPVNVKKVREFVARYADDNDEFPSLSAPMEARQPGAGLTAAAVAVGEPPSNAAKKTRGKGGGAFIGGIGGAAAVDRGAGTTFGSPTVSEGAFPVIDFPSAKRRKTQDATAALHGEEKSHFAFATPSEVSGKEKGKESELPQIQPIDFTPPSSTEAMTVEDADDTTPGFSFTVDPNGEFRIIDDVSDDEPEPPAEPVMLTELPRDESSEASWEPPQVDSQAVGQPDAVALTSSDQSRDQDVLAPLQADQVVTMAKPRRRMKKTSVRVGRRQVAPMTAEEPDEDVLILTGGAESAEWPQAKKPGRKKKTLASPDMGMQVAPVDDGRAEDMAVVKKRKRGQVRLTQDLVAPLKTGTHDQPAEIDHAPSLAEPHQGERPELTPEQKQNLDPCLVSFSAPESFEAEQYRMLRYLVERLKGERGKTCIVGVTSPSAGDGKTTTVLNLAGSLAQAADVRVLLIDADLRRPAVEARLGEKPAGVLGLTDAIMRSHLRLQDITTHYHALNLTVLPAGQATTSPYEVLKSPRFGELLQEARRTYDYVVIDTPPLVPIPDCRLIGKWVDGFFVVVGAHKTPRKLVREALAVMEEEKILGLVLNGGDSPVFGYDQYYGYAYGGASKNQPGRTA